MFEISMHVTIIYAVLWIDIFAHMFIEIMMAFIEIFTE